MVSPRCISVKVWLWFRIKYICIRSPLNREGVKGHLPGSANLERASTERRRGVLTVIRVS